MDKGAKAEQRVMRDKLVSNQKLVMYRFFSFTFLGGVA
jgi:hypothetical protein